MWEECSGCTGRGMPFWKAWKINDLTPKELRVFYLAGAEGQLSPLCPGPSPRLPGSVCSGGFWILAKVQAYFYPAVPTQEPTHLSSQRQWGSGEKNNFQKDKWIRCIAHRFCSMASCMILLLPHIFPRFYVSYLYLFAATWRPEKYITESRTQAWLRDW